MEKEINEQMKKRERASQKIITWVIMATKETKKIDQEIGKKKLNGHV